MKNLLLRFLPPISILVFGVILLAVGCSSLKQVRTFTEINAVVTSADKDSYYDSDGNLQENITVYVEYTVDGVTYNEMLESPPSDALTGDSIKVRYNPEKPSQVTAATKGGSMIGIILGSIMLLGGLLFLAFKLITGR